MKEYLHWFVKPAEPRSRYALLVAIGVVVMMALTQPIWWHGGPGMAAFAAVASVIISMISAKLIMRQ